MSTTAADRDAPEGFDPAPAGRPGPGPLAYARKGLKALASLQLTVVLFSFAILLVFFGTLAQMDFGIWTTIDQYFWSWVVWVPVDLFNKFGQVFLAESFPKGGPPWKGTFPLPGGKLLGGLMLVNLLAAHLTRFRISWKRSGILLTHSGLLLLFVGEFVTREYAVEQRMTIPEGGSVDYAEDTRAVELAVIDKSDPASDLVVVVPQNLLKAGGRVTDPDLPFDIRVDEFMANSSLEAPSPGKPNPATAGFGKARVAVRRAEVSGVDPNQKVDMPAAYLTLSKPGTDEPLGTHLVALRLYLMGHADEVEVGGKKYDLGMRFLRYMKPYRIQLQDFRFDRYPGTNQAKNFSSDVKVFDAAGAEVLERTIRMNDPLRYAGETFYQSSFDEETETTTVLQVVKNPGWVIPYVSCVVVTVGLLVHFGITLNQFLRRRAAA
ncbi:MAG: cytochrome c biogenesis protein ResB [Gemmataceae bacterium]|nr:cytochrome c biogenesis protein ResB [Gemmataceae bacterium]